MEVDDNAGDEDVSLSPVRRHRTASMTDDSATQQTNDDVTASKIVAVQKGYWRDDYVHRFAPSSLASPTPETIRRDPEINIGHWARVEAISHFVKKFINAVGASAQILNLGCGYDTLYWRLKSAGLPFALFVEVDFSSVTTKKIRQMLKPCAGPDLKALFSAAPSVSSSHTDLHAGDYHLVGADLRQIGELNTKLDSTGIKSDAPCLILTECVLVYMNTEKSGELLRSLSGRFSAAAVINYEQCNVDDSFGHVMERNLATRGLLLPGFSACTSLETHRQRFLANGYDHVLAWTMKDVYSSVLPVIDSGKEIRRVEAIEKLDEMELLLQLLHHYALVVASKKSIAHVWQ